ncbi:MAG: S8 family serine peptidase [Gammaproteobacteria bacterium]|nr:S8 family serine peptidase [Gammaproteobacteria bacterium]
MFTRLITRHTVTLTLCALMAACGGGGSNVRQAPPPSHVVLGNSNLDIAGFRESWSSGYQGSGVEVAVIDSGVRTTHEAFSGRISVNSRNIVAQEYGGDIDDISDPAAGDGGHGTAMASILLGSHPSNELGGAPEAKLMMLRISDNNGVLQPLIPEAIDYARSKNVKIVNISLGYPSSWPELDSAMQAAKDADMLVIMAAGNEGYSNPSGYAAKAADPNLKGSMLVVGAVDNYGTIRSYSNRAGTTQQWYLTAPDEAAIAWYEGDYDYGTGTGTSTAAPLVSAAATLLKQKWPHLTGMEIATLLLKNATDLGAIGVDAIYGWGLLNIDAALQPVSPLMIPLSDNLNANLAPAASTAMLSATAFGDALLKTTALSDIVAFDNYGRDYPLDLRNSVAPSSRLDVSASLHRSLNQSPGHSIVANGIEVSMRGRSDNLAGWSLSGDAGIVGTVTMAAALPGVGALRLGVVDRPDSTSLLGQDTDTFTTPLIGDNLLTNPYLGLAANSQFAAFSRPLGKVTASFSYLEGEAQSTLHQDLFSRGRIRGTLLDLSYRHSESHIGIQAGVLHEEAGLLGSASSGALSLFPSAETKQLTLYGKRTFSGMTLFSGYSLGWTQTSGNSLGLPANSGTLISDAFTMGAKWVGNRETGYNITLSSPLRVSRGSLSLQVPVGRTLDGQVVTAKRHVDLTPSGRELNLELSTKRQINKGQLRAGVLFKHQPGHTASAATEAVGIVTWQQAF